mmetsp:Transcript_89884/g.228657  ORF Transcript_89884/g.228657 Transcript_89884/m.228657 type:complete len:261 (+) Transcript_89884:1078-1860(+)
MESVLGIQRLAHTAGSATAAAAAAAAAVDAPAPVDAPGAGRLAARTLPVPKRRPTQCLAALGHRLPSFPSMTLSACAAPPRAQAARNGRTVLHWRHGGRCRWRTWMGDPKRCPPLAKAAAVGIAAVAAAVIAAAVAAALAAGAAFAAALTALATNTRHRRGPLRESKPKPCEVRCSLGILAMTLGTCLRKGAVQPATSCKMAVLHMESRPLDNPTSCAPARPGLPASKMHRCCRPLRFNLKDVRNARPSRGAQEGTVSEV